MSYGWDKAGINCLSPMTNHIDYSQEVNPARSIWLQRLFSILGFFFFVVGVVGIFVPLLPTTPFLLLSAGCFRRASPKHYNWLMNHNILGAYIHDWRAEKGIPLRAKVLAITVILVTFGLSSFRIQTPYLKALFLLPAIVAIIIILRVPTRR